MTSSYFEDYKYHIIAETFVRTADENYITARWCAQTQQHTDFNWLAVHALEKYMKAVLLANGKSTKCYSHNIVKLHQALKTFCDDSLLPENFGIQSSMQVPKTVAYFVENLWAVGQPHNRYGIFGSSIRKDDLLNLDALIFALRRLICPLDEIIESALFQPWQVEDEDERSKLNVQAPTYRDWLRAHPDQIMSHSHGGHLGDIIKDEKHLLKNALLNGNLAFAPTNYQHDWSWLQICGRNSVVDRFIYSPLVSNETKAEDVAIAVELAEWWVANVKTPFVDEMNSAIAAANARLRLK